MSVSWAFTGTRTKPVSSKFGVCLWAESATLPKPTDSLASDSTSFLAGKSFHVLSTSISTVPEWSSLTFSASCKDVSSVKPSLEILLVDLSKDVISL